MMKKLIKATLLAALLPLANCVAVEVTPVCGDGFTERLEACDDGNNRNGDGCSASCSIETLPTNPVCGDTRKEGTEACDDGNTMNGDGCSSTCTDEPGIKYGVSWKIKTNDIPGACPTGFDTARVIAHPSSLPDTDNSQDKIDLFNCAAGQGVSAEVPRRSYNVYVEIVNNNGTAVYAQSVPVAVDLSTTSADASFDIHTDRGFYYLNWALQSRAGAALQCAQVPGLSKIALDATINSSQLPISTTFDCLQQAGYSRSLVATNYQLAVAGINNQPVPGLVTDTTTIANKLIAAPNRFTDLGTVVILVP
jgi:cysteine-rich repeat protein